MLYSASSCLSPAASRCRSCSISEVGTSVRGLPGDQEPDERQPELAGKGNGTIVNQHFGLVGTAENLEQFPQPDRIARPETRAIPMRRAAPGFEKFGGLACERKRP